MIDIYAEEDKYIYSTDKEGYQCKIEIKENGTIEIIENNKKYLKKG